MCDYLLLSFAEWKELKATNDRFNEELQMQIDGTLPVGHIYQLGMPGNVLLSCGFPNSLYLNKEKIQDLINQQRKNLADVKYLDLDSVANVIECFENPSVAEEKVLFSSDDSSFRRVDPVDDAFRQQWDALIASRVFLHTETMVD